MPARNAHGIVRVVAVENQPSRSSVAGAAPPARATAAAANVPATASTATRIGLVVRRLIAGAVLMRKVSATATAMSAPAVTDHEATASASPTVAPPPTILTGLRGHPSVAARRRHELGQALGGGEQCAPDEDRCQRGHGDDPACHLIGEPALGEGQQDVDGDHEHRRPCDLPEGIEAGRRQGVEGRRRVEGQREQDQPLPALDAPVQRDARDRRHRGDQRSVEHPLDRWMLEVGAVRDGDAGRRGEPCPGNAVCTTAGRGPAGRGRGRAKTAARRATSLPGDDCMRVPVVAWAHPTGLLEVVSTVGTTRSDSPEGARRPRQEQQDRACTRRLTSSESGRSSLAKTELMCFSTARLVRPRVSRSPRCSCPWPSPRGSRARAAVSVGSGERSAASSPATSGSTTLGSRPSRRRRRSRSPPAAARGVEALLEQVGAALRAGLQQRQRVRGSE